MSLLDIISNREYHTDYKNLNDDEKKIVYSIYMQNEVKEVLPFPTHRNTKKPKK